MGEAKRRALSDPDYGQVFNLDSTAAKTQHCDAVIDELFTTFATEIKFLIRTARFPDNYDLICTHITDWLNQRLLRYRKNDQEYIAQSLLSSVKQLDDCSVIDEYEREVEVSPVVICCIFQATKSYFSDQAKTQMKLRLQTILQEFSHHQETQLFGQSLLEQIED